MSSAKMMYDFLTYLLLTVPVSKVKEMIESGKSIKELLSDITLKDLIENMRGNELRMFMSAFAPQIAQVMTSKGVVDELGDVTMLDLIGMIELSNSDRKVINDIVKMAKPSIVLPLLKVRYGRHPQIAGLIKLLETDKGRKWLDQFLSDIRDILSHK